MPENVALQVNDAGMCPKDAHISSSAEVVHTVPQAVNLSGSALFVQFFLSHYMYLEFLWYKCIHDKKATTLYFCVSGT